MANAAQTNRDAVLAAVAEFDSLGRETFLNRYGFKPARTYNHQLKLLFAGKTAVSTTSANRSIWPLLDSN